VCATGLRRGGLRRSPGRVVRLPILPDSQREWLVLIGLIRLRDALQSARVGGNGA